MEDQESIYDHINRLQWADALQQCLISKRGDLHNILYQLMNSGAQVKLIPHPCVTCIFHQEYFPKENIRLPYNTPMIDILCPTPNHKACKRCLHEFFKEWFNNYGFSIAYQCPVCVYLNIDGNIDILNPQELFTQIFGEDAIDYMLNNVSTRTQTKTFNKRNKFCDNLTTNSCTGGKNHYSIGNCIHTECEKCIEKVVKNTSANSKAFKCGIGDCEENIYHQIVRKALENSETLDSLWGRLNLDDVKQLFCVNSACKKRCEVENEVQVFTCPHCLNKMCVSCGTKAHEGITCREFYVNEQKFHIKEINAEGEFAEEYNRALFVFTEFIQNTGFRVHKVEMIVNPELLRKFNQKKEALTKKLGDPAELYVWHSTPKDVVRKIAEEGFRIGGVGGHAIGNGKALGLGVYSAVEPSFTFGYGRGCNEVLCCRAVRGFSTSTNKAENERDLKNPDVHSYMSGNVIVFFETEQLLPEFIVTYGN